jgi:uncharacterized protein YecE (DUF72 family)
VEFDRRDLAARMRFLAERGVYIGTSSWKYPGWCGILYDPARYEWHGRFADARFRRNCLSEYAEVFKSVGVDSAYYSFPSRDSLEEMAGHVPDDFLFGIKVTDAITLKKFPGLDRFGDQAGKPNENYLNAELFQESFLLPCHAIRSKVGLIMFEFSRFHPVDYTRGRDFVADLDTFLGKLPDDWAYGVEIRNRNWLTSDYFACLSRRRACHIFNSWEAMPPVDEQMALPGSRTNPGIRAARLLLKPGRKYKDAVRAFEPYDSIKEEVAPARAAGRALILEGLAAPPTGKTFIWVNNRLEGNAILSISAMVQQIS